MIKIQSKLNDVVSYGKAELNAQFIELRHISIERTTIDLRDGKGNTINGFDAGTAIRVLVDGSWGFVSIAAKTDIDELKRGVKNAISLAKLGASYSKTPINLFPVEPRSDTKKLKLNQDPREIPVNEKKDRMQSLHKMIVESDEKNRIKSSHITYTDITGTQYYQNSDGIEITMDKCVTWAKVLVNGKNGNIRAGGREEIGSSLGFWIFNENNLNKIGNKLVNRVIQTLAAKPAKGGDFPAILGPPVAGVLAHEACGHLFEADLTQNGVIGTVLGKKIGSEKATIIDDGTYPDCIGTFPYDDEGIPAQKTTILDKGRVNALLTNREYAYKFALINEKLEDKIEFSASGNARAFDFRKPPIIRMRNTYFETGDYSWDELLEGIDFGYYFVDFRGGQASLEGTFTVGIQEVYKIINGEIDSPVRGASISGNTLETLLKISAVGKDDFYLTPGRCGKVQTIFATSGGPNIRVDRISVSGEK